MESFPPNNNSDKAKKKVERVTVSDATRRKPPIGRRVLGTFIKGDARQAWATVLMDVLVPAAKDMAADALSQGFERMIYGEARSRSRRPGYRPDYGNGSYTNYNRFSSGSNRPRQEDPRRPLSRQSRGNHNFDEIIISNRAEAEAVIDQLFSLVSQYDSATVADLYELVGITGEYTDEKWGWLDVRGATVTRVRDGYLLDLPRPEPLD